MNEIALQAAQFWTRAAEASTAQKLKLQLPIQSTSAQSPDQPAQIRLLLPGSFNPLHAGHRGIADFASKLYALPCWFELTLRNADKGLISESDLQQRLAQDFGPHGIVLSTAAKFVDKCKLFPGATFILGSDTIVRLADPQYYNNSRDAMLQSFSRIAQSDNRFLVFGRTINGQFPDTSMPELPTELSVLCRFVDQSEFAMDVSSTQLREGK